MHNFLSNDVSFTYVVFDIKSECLRYGHCVAICPVNAFTIDEYGMLCSIYCISKTKVFRIVFLRIKINLKLLKTCIKTYLKNIIPKLELISNF